MSWLNDGTGPESDLLSVALGESGLDLNAQESLTDVGKSESTEHNSGYLAGATLSLESTSTPNDLLNWAFLLSNQNSQTLPPTQDDLSSILDSFNDFPPANDYPTLSNKASISKELDLYFGPGNRNTEPQNTNHNSDANFSLKDLLSTENDFSNSFTKKPVNGVNSSTRK